MLLGEKAAFQTHTSRPAGGGRIYLLGIDAHRKGLVCPCLPDLRSFFCGTAHIQRNRLGHLGDFQTCQKEKQVTADEIQFTGENMELNEMIYHRKSCRSFTGKPVEAETIEKILAFNPKPLYPEIRVHWDIVSRDQVKCIFPWTTPQVIAVYSEETEGYLENTGFLFQQMDLYLQTLGLGVCWLGIGRMNPKTAPEVEGMKFVIMLAFGHPKSDPLRYELKGFKRKSLDKIADGADPRLEPARLAPSSINSQPWYFVHEGETIHAYCFGKGIIPYMNCIDMGIVLAHLYVANEKSFRFFKVENAPEVAGYGYSGSFLIQEKTT